MTDSAELMFTVSQVERLHRHQFGTWSTLPGMRDGNLMPRTHPFTCPNRGDGSHFDNGSDLGALIPTVRDWVCQCCDYTQGWAHDFMKGSP